ncbi:hypothetical protein D3C73_1644700 [compost metagenome]
MAFQSGAYRLAADHTLPPVAACPKLFSSSRVNSRPVLRLCATAPVAKSARRLSWSVRMVFCWSLKVGRLRARV